MTYRGPFGCISGTVNPFTIESTKCEDTTGAAPQQVQTLNCSTACQAGTRLTPSVNDTDWDGFATVPSNPSTTYCQTGCTNISTASDWIGLESCPFKTCAQTELFQAGIYYGYNSTYTSQHPIMFEEYATYTGSCHTTFCGDVTKAVGVGDSVYFNVNYDAAASYWDLYSQDTTSNIYQTYYVYVPSETSLTSIQHAITAEEGQQATSASYYPSTFTFTQQAGQTSSGTYQLGTQHWWLTSNGTISPTATISYSTSSCGYAGTCASTSISMN